MTRVRRCPSGWAVVRSSHDPVVRAVIEHGIPGVWNIAHSTPFGPSFKKKHPRSGPFGSFVNEASDRLRRQRY